MPASNHNILSDTDIATLAMSELNDADKSTIAVAIALAESGGDADAVNYVPCVGLWQINCKNQMHGLTVAQAKDPKTNAKAMASISSGGTNWHPWTTWTHGTYKKFLDRASAAVKAIGGTLKDLKTGIQIASTATIDPGAVLQAGFNQITKSFRETLLLTLPVFIALVLLILGIILLNRDRIKAGAKSVGKAGAFIATKGAV